MSEPLYVTFTANKDGETVVGWVTFSEATPITNGDDIMMVTREIEKERSYDAGSVVITNFRRLEKAEA